MHIVLLYYSIILLLYDYPCFYKYVKYYHRYYHRSLKQLKAGVKNTGNILLLTEIESNFLFVVKTSYSKAMICPHLLPVTC